MTDFAFPIERPSAAIAGSAQRFPVRRIYCVGRNYADHAREMGADPSREVPFFFCKPGDAIVANGSAVPYPTRTDDLQHEVELVVAIGRPGRRIPAQQALACVWGYAVGNDLTRRDLQTAAKKSGRPWDIGKGFDHSAPVAPLRPVGAGHLDSGRIWLSVNGQTRQDSDLREMIWKTPEIIAELSSLFELQPGDLIFTGTPAGVGKLSPGDRVAGGIDGLESLHYTIGAR